MPNYRMIAKDVNSAIITERVWQNDSIDLDGYYYYKAKAGKNKLSKAVVHSVPDGYNLDFALPNPSYWLESRFSLPENLTGSQFCFIDGYGYLFGGESSSNIYRCDGANPFIWSLIGQLPTNLSHSQLFKISDKLFLFGGRIDGYATDNIYAASTNSPHIWTQESSYLPMKLESSQLAVIDNDIYLFGGYDGYNLTSKIFKSTLDDPTIWTDPNRNLSVPTAASSLIISDGQLLLLGGIARTETEDGYYIGPTNLIQGSLVSDPTNINPVQILPYPCCYGQTAIIGSNIFLFSSVYKKNNTNRTSIFRANIHDPKSWVRLNKVVPGSITESQLAILDDRIYLFGGNGNTSIYYSDIYAKYVINQNVADYENRTRTNFIYDNSSMFVHLGFAPWKTDYGYYVPPNR